MKTTVSLVQTLCAAVALSAGALAQATSVAEDPDHVSRWNRFASQVYALHQQRLVGQDVQHTERIGEYGGVAAKGYQFREVSYTDQRTGRLLSRVRTDRNRKDSLHIVEVFVRDDAGRLDRDYAAVYLPWARNAPIRTFITLHDYPQGLHAERQFDANGDRIFERCTGTHDGEKVYLTHDWDEIGLRSGRTPLYETCFAGLQERVGKYREPQ